jgi:hypothetical protein
MNEENENENDVLTMRWFHGYTAFKIRLAPPMSEVYLTEKRLCGTAKAA